MKKTLPRRTTAPRTGKVLKLRDGAPNRRLGRPPNLLRYFGDKETALQFLESQWGPQSPVSKESPWVFLQTARLWIDLVERPDSNRQSFDDLKTASEVLTKVAAKLRKARIEIQTVVVWVREGVGSSTRRSVYEVSFGSTPPRIQFRRVLPAHDTQGLHYFDPRLPFSAAIDDAVSRALGAWHDSLGLDEDQYEHLRHRLELWCSRYVALKLKHGQYLNADPLLLVLLQETATIFGLQTPDEEETRALELLATEGKSGNQDVRGGDVKKGNDRWRKAIAALPRWRAKLVPTAKSSE